MLALSHEKLDLHWLILTLPDVAITFCGSVLPLKLPSSGDLNESPSYTNT